MQIEQKRFSKTTGWEIMGECSCESFSADIVLVNGSNQMLAEAATLKSIRQRYPLAIIIINPVTDAELNEKKYFDTVSLSAISLSNSKFTTAVIHISSDLADRQAGRLLAEYCCQANLKSMLMLSSENKIQGIESIEQTHQLIPALTIVAENNKLLIGLLEGLHENVIIGDIKSIGFYEEQFALNFGTTDGAGVFELDRRLTKSKEKFVYQLKQQSGVYQNYMGEKSNDFSSQDTIFPICVNLHNRWEDEERRRIMTQLENKNRQIQLLAEELQRSQEDAAFANAALEKKNKELEQFAYIASHDLQEPIRMISGFLTQLDKRYGDAMDERAQKYIEFAVDGATRMRQIINDLLEFSRVGRAEGNVEKIDLNELVN